MPAGRPAIDIDIEAFRQLCRLQCTTDEIAAFFNVSKDTVERRLKHKEFRDAWNHGKAHGRASLRRLQWKHAQGTGAGAVHMTIHLSKHWLGETERAAIEHTGKDGGPIKHDHAGAKEQIARAILSLAEREDQDGDSRRLN